MARREIDALVGQGPAAWAEHFGQQAAERIRHCNQVGYTDKDERRILGLARMAWSYARRVDAETVTRSQEV